jgi:hypothetical protein
MDKKIILLVFVLMLSPLITPIATVGQSNDSTSEIELKYQTPRSSPKGWIYVLVETSVFDGIETSLDQYATDLESIEGLSVGIYTVSTSNTTAIRALLQQALPEGLVGCLLVGDIPAAYYEYGPPENPHTFPTDFYYMDLDGVWDDTDSDGVYDKHGGKFGADIWVGRLQPSLVDGDDIWLLNNYFKKNHLYRTGKLTLPKRALVYADALLINVEAWVNNTRIAYDETVLISGLERTNASDYRKRLVEGYEWISLECHGSPGSHTFIGHGDGTLTGLDYREIDPHTFFYVFDVCHAAAGYNSLASSVVFTNTSGLLAIGPKDMDYKWGPDATFYQALSDGKSIGEAYLEDIKFYEYENKAYPEFSPDARIPCYEYWWVMVGDPSLHIKGYTQQAESSQMWIIAVIVTITGVGAVFLVYFTKFRKAKKTTESNSNPKVPNMDIQ